jgi:REP element-mobilizing transposase RayT
MSPKNILIITPYSDFGEILSQSLGKEASLDVKVASTESAVLAYIKKDEGFHYALLDMELGVEKVLEHGFALRNRFPSIGLILISKKDPPREMDSLLPWKLLRKPFVQNELTSLFQEGNETFRSEREIIDLNFRDETGDAVHAWFEDEVRVTKTLVAAISTLDVQEAILFSNEDILAHAGDMLPDAMDECSRLVRKCRREKDAAEMIKPVHLNTTSSNYLLHASVVAVGILLALLYDADTPYKIMRGHTRYLTNILKNPQLSVPEAHILPEIPEAELENHLGHSVSVVLDRSDFNTKNTTKPRHPRPAQPYRRAWKHQEAIAFRQESAVSHFQQNSINRDDKSSESVDATTARSVGRESSAAWTSATQPQPVNPNYQASDWVQETLHWAGSSVQGTREAHRYSLGPADPSLFNVYYACLLVPRIQSQLLDGDLANCLREEFPNIFMAYGWRLEALDIDQSYLQWLVRIPPTIAPDAHIKVVRRQSSQKVLTSFARLNRDELLRDFWAPGYLLGCGQRLLPAEDIAEFIRINRNQHYPDASLYRIHESKYQTNHGKYQPIQ